MLTRVGANISAFNAHRHLTRASTDIGASLASLSSGLRVNRASDDAAGLSISETMRAQVRGMAQAERNVLDGLSLLNLAEGALSEVHAGLQRFRELAVQAANGTLSASDREAVRLEMFSLERMIGDTIVNAEYNGQHLFSVNGSYWHTTPHPLLPPGTDSVTFQVGANAGETVGVRLDL